MSIWVYQHVFIVKIFSYILFLILSYTYYLYCKTTFFLKIAPQSADIQIPKSQPLFCCVARTHYHHHQPQHPSVLSVPLRSAWQLYPLRVVDSRLRWISINMCMREGTAGNELSRLDLRLSHMPPNATPPHPPQLLISTRNGGKLHIHYLWHRSPAECVRSKNFISPPSALPPRRACSCHRLDNV